jgi:hypothetical protein
MPKPETNWDAAQRSRLISVLMFIAIFLVSDAVYGESNPGPGTAIIMLIAAFVLTFFIRMALHSQIERYAKSAKW